MATTSIQWTDRVWNPVTGCTKVSQGCKHCYAETIADRFWATQYPKVEFCGEQLPRPRRFTDVWTHEDRLAEPLSWRKPARVFVNSMSDLFHEDVPDEFIDRVFAVMALAERHTFQILTKRADRMRAYMSDGRDDRVRPAVQTILHGQHHPAKQYPLPWPLPNVWLGVSVENQKYADERIPLLLQTPAAVRFISAEPLLGPVDLRDWPKMFRNDHIVDVSGDAYNSLDWVIVGGESGSGARPMDLEWARSIVAQCRADGVACFVKQLGSAPLFHDCDAKGICKLSCHCYASGARRLHDRKGGDPSEWPEDLRVREYPA